MPTGDNQNGESGRTTADSTEGEQLLVLRRHLGRTAYVSLIAELGFGPNQRG